jgi:hypothetical protein
LKYSTISSSSAEFPHDELPLATESVDGADVTMFAVGAELVAAKADAVGLAEALAVALAGWLVLGLAEALVALGVGVVDAVGDTDGDGVADAELEGDAELVADAEPETSARGNNCSDAASLPTTFDAGDFFTTGTLTAVRT